MSKLDKYLGEQQEIDPKIASQIMDKLYSMTDQLSDISRLAFKAGLKMKASDWTPLRKQLHNAEDMMGKKLASLGYKGKSLGKI